MLGVILNQVRPVNRLRLILLVSLAAGLTMCGMKASDSDAEDLARIEEMYASYQRKFPNVAGVSADEVQRLREEGDVVLVDVRDAKERKVSIIPGALSREEFEAKRSEYADSTVVTYCTIGARSGQYAAELAKQGLDVRNFEGSILSWTHAGGELVGPDGPTRKVHVYGKRWNLAADGYEAVW